MSAPTWMKERLHDLGWLRSRRPTLDQLRESLRSYQRFHALPETTGELDGPTKRSLQEPRFCGCPDVMEQRASVAKWPISKVTFAIGGRLPGLSDGDFKQAAVEGCNTINAACGIELTFVTELRGRLTSSWALAPSTGPAARWHGPNCPTARFAGWPRNMTRWNAGPCSMAARQLDRLAARADARKLPCLRPRPWPARLPDGADGERDSRPAGVGHPRAGRPLPPEGDADAGGPPAAGGAPGRLTADKSAGRGSATNHDPRHRANRSDRDSGLPGQQAADRRFGQLKCTIVLLLPSAWAAWRAWSSPGPGPGRRRPIRRRDPTSSEPRHPATPPGHEVPRTPEAHADLAAAFLMEAVPYQDWHRVLFVSFYSTDADELTITRAIGRFWTNELSREKLITQAVEVPCSGGRLFLLFIDEYGWNRPAINSVVKREPFFITDAVDCHVAAFLRRAVGFDDPCHAGAIVSAEWLIHDTSDTTLSSGYYDLLYARERFPFSVPATPPKTAAPAAKGYAAPPPAKERAVGEPSKNFPENEADFAFAFGAEQAVKLSFDPKRRLEVDSGVIVDEGDSIVAYHMRLIVGVRTPLGRYHRTFDFDRTTRKQDIIEFFNLRQTVCYQNLVHQASEVITNKPNGGQAYLLTNGVGKRAEFADPLKIARDTTNIVVPVVRTPRSCVVCHARGVNPPRNLMLAAIEAGIDTKLKDPDLARRVEALLQQDLQKVIAEDQGRYIDFVKQTSGLGPEQNAAAYKRLLERYEAKLDTKRMAREFGSSVEELKDLARWLARFRGQSITQEWSVPRTVWELDVYPDLVRLKQLQRRKK